VSGGNYIRIPLDDSGSHSAVLSGAHIIMVDNWDTSARSYWRSHITHDPWRIGALTLSGANGVGLWGHEAAGTGVSSERQELSSRICGVWQVQSRLPYPHAFPGCRSQSATP
jgi:hypothetical protein